MSDYTSEKLAFNNAEQFKEQFFEPTPDIGYVFLGRSLSWPDEDSPTTATDTVATEKDVWLNMFGAKKVTGVNVELVTPRRNWATGKKYKEFDDTVDIGELLTANTTSGLQPMYVMTTNRNVYLCLNNNLSANSTVEPTGQNLSANGNISTADGYKWKYLYNVRASSRFLTDNWMPVPTSTSQLDYDVSSTVAVDGELSHIIVTGAGSGYIHSNITIGTFASGCTTLTVANTTNLSANMAITGTGIAGSTHISSLDALNSQITISKSTTSAGGGTGNNATVSTRVYIDGDGTGAVGSVTLSGNTISKIAVDVKGTGYSRANVSLFGTGSSATARAVLPPKYGHGYNSAKQLGAKNVMISTKIGEIDTTEDGLISANTSFRQYGLLRNPHKYGNSSPVTTGTANNVVSQTTDITVTSGDDYELNELVFQGDSSSAATFSGVVNDFTSTVVKLTNVKGTLTLGDVVKGTNTNTSGRTSVSVKRPEFQSETGDILYLDNITKIQRTTGQAENLKFVIKF